MVNCLSGWENKTNKKSKRNNKMGNYPKIEDPFVHFDKNGPTFTEHVFICACGYKITDVNENRVRDIMKQHQLGQHPAVRSKP